MMGGGGGLPATDGYQNLLPAGVGFEDLVQSVTSRGWDEVVEPQAHGISSFLHLVANP